MATLPVLTWIRNAAAVLFGPHGAITAQAQQAGCSRQAAYDHAQRVQQAVANAQGPGPTRDHLLQENQRLRQEAEALRHEVQRLQAQAATRVDFSPPQQQRWAVTLTAWGLSLRQIEGLFDGLLGDAGPGHATLGRWTAAAGRRAAQVLAALDAAARPLVREQALDEIFVRGRPILVAVEPASLALGLARRAADCTGPTWAEALAPFTALEYAICDGGGGLRAGLEALQRQRAAAAPPAGAPAEADVPPPPLLELGRDLFHIEADAQPQLRRRWRPVALAWERAEAADAALARERRQGKGAGPAATRARHAWDRAGRALAAYEVHEATWRRAQAALRVFRPDGRLNDPTGAAAELHAVAAALPGEGWAAVRRALRDPRTLMPLRRLHRRLAAAVPAAPLRQALVRLLEVENAARRAAPAAAGLWAVRRALQRRVCAQVAAAAEAVGEEAADWEAAYARVRAVVRGVVRASSCVECVNSVLRMHQARHRQLPQGLLDLKRLWWNCHRFASGRRRKACPYELLGLRLPTYDFWELLQGDPAALGAALAQQAQELSSTEVAA